MCGIASVSFRIKRKKWAIWIILGQFLCGSTGTIADPLLPPSNGEESADTFSPASGWEKHFAFSIPTEGIPKENASFPTTAPEISIYLADGTKTADSLNLSKNEDHLSLPPAAPIASDTLEGSLPADWRRQIAEQQERVRQLTDKYPSALHPLLQAAMGWLERAAEVGRKWQDSSSELAQLKTQREALEQQFHRTQQKVEAVGRTHTIGLLLRKQQAALPDPRAIQRQIRTRQPEIQAATLELFDCQDRRTELNQLPAEVQRRWQQLGPPPEGVSSHAWRQAITELVLLEQEQLDRLLRILQGYFETLGALDEVQTGLLQLVEQYRDYVNEHIFWIRSTTPLDADTFQHMARALYWLVQWDHAVGFVEASFEGVQARPWAVGGVLGVLVVWGYTARRFRRRVPQIGVQAQQGQFCRFRPTLETVGMTAAAAGFRPALLWLAPWCFGWTLSRVEFVRAAAETLQWTALWLLPWEVLLASCQERGLAESHFGWPGRSVLAMRRWLRTGLAAVLPLVMLTTVFHYQSEERFDSSLGRAAFLGLMVVWAGGLAWLLRAKGEFVRGLVSRETPPSWLRFRLGVYWLSVLTPIGLALLAASGYYYTAQQLAERVYASLVAIVGVVWLGAILRRGVVILRRRLAMARRNSSAPHHLPASPPETSAVPPQTLPPSESDLPTADEKTTLLPNLSQLAEQVDRLLGVLLFLGTLAAIGVIWRDILPALAILKRIPLWTISWETIAAAGASGTSGASPVQMHWVSAADLLWSVVVLVVAYLAAKNLPALLELLLPQKLPFDQGARYALKTLLQYVVVFLGLLIGLPPLGVTWSRMQWLLAALGVGLGFGLQEIFANFVSGLILLFERPIRVGDIITIGDVTGVVSKIHIRAAIITNWDRQDLIVPNKELITSRVLNWTLTNQTNRIVLQVGAAYGSDPDRVRQILEEILRAHPLVLRDPAPLVTLENLGDSALQFTIRAYLPALDKRLQTIHELYTAIHNRFRHEGIEIPYPQRQLHIRSWSSPVQEASS